MACQFVPQTLKRRQMKWYFNITVVPTSTSAAAAGVKRNCQKSVVFLLKLGQVLLQLVNELCDPDTKLLSTCLTLRDAPSSSSTSAMWLVSKLLSAHLKLRGHSK